MENEMDKKEERIVKLEAIAKFTLITFIIISIILFFMVFPVVGMISYVGIPSLIIFPLVGSFIVLIAGFLIYHVLLVKCDMARSLISIDEQIFNYVYSKSKQPNKNEMHE